MTSWNSWSVKSGPVDRFKTTAPKFTLIGIYSSIPAWPPPVHSSGTHLQDMFWSKYAIFSALVRLQRRSVQYGPNCKQEHAERYSGRDIEQTKICVSLTMTEGWSCPDLSWKDEPIRRQLGIDVTYSEFERRTKIDQIRSPARLERI